MRKAILDDPVMCLLVRAVDEVSRAGFSQGSPGIDEKASLESLSLRDTIWDLRRFIAKCRHDDNSEASLDYVLHHFKSVEHELEKAWARTFAVLEYVQPEWSKDRLVKYCDLWRGHAELLLTMVRSLTPAHLALQSHFVSFVRLWPRLEWADEAAARKLFEPLWLLRDDYFTKPRAGLISEYLVLAESLAVDKLYLAEPTAKAKPRAVDEALLLELENYTLSLEALSLMEDFA